VNECALCGDDLDTEHPLSIYGRNPQTYRKAWMHFYCFQSAFEQLQYERASSDDCMNRLDEYLTHWVDLP
jgi:hypothetical protein